MCIAAVFMLLCASDVITQLEILLLFFKMQLIDDWTFDVFALSDASAGSPLRYLGIDLLNRYGVIHKFKVRKRFPFPLLLPKAIK